MGFSALIEVIVTALFFPEGHNRIIWTHIRQQALWEGLFNKKIDENLNAVVLESRLLRKFEKVASLPLHRIEMTEITLDNQDFIASVPKFLIKKQRRLSTSNCKGKIKAENLSRPTAVQAHGSHRNVTDPRQTSLMKEKTRRRSLGC